jgi:hypothetical protein
MSVMHFPFCLKASLLSDAEIGQALDAILNGDWRHWVPKRLPPCSEVKDPCDFGFLGLDPKFK